MSESLTIGLSDDLKAQIEALSSADGVPAADRVRRAIGARVVRLVLDSHILISAFISRGLCTQVPRAASAHAIITGDRDLLDLIAHGGMRIVSPRQFWELLKD
jgi:hypothetical protein